MFKKKLQIPSAETALVGRAEKMLLSTTAHYVHQHDITAPWPAGFEQAMFGMGCFWGAEKLFWQLDGMWITAVGYAAGHTPNATYAEVCTGKTGHNEVVLAVYDPSVISYASLLSTFWQGHNPTQSMRQGNDVGTQYRSGIYIFSDQQQAAATRSKQDYQSALDAQGFNDIQTEIMTASEFYYAEEAHQQYLAKNPAGYCGLGGTGVACPAEGKS